MGSNPTQALGIVFFLLGFVLLGLAFAGGGFLAGIGALVLLGISAFFFMKCKPWEHQSQDDSGAYTKMAAGEVKG
jgi:hypothetical protein